MTMRRVLPLCCVMLVSIVVCIVWIDLPLARFMARFGFGYRVFTNSTVQLPVMTSLAFAGLLLGLGYLIAGKKTPRWIEAAMIAGIAVLVGQMVTHELLKPTFGRIVPSVYLRTGEHGFRWFHHGLRYGSFPSGHSTEAAGMLSVAWLYYPRWRWAYAGLMLLLALALMLGRWHYLGDVLAGTLVGALVGTSAALIWGKISAAFNLRRI